MALTVTTDRYADVIVLRPTGRVTCDLAATFRGVLVAAVEEGGTGLVVLDLSGLDYIASAGIQALARCARACRDRGGRMLVACLTPRIDEMFATARLHHLFAATSTLTEALVALSVDAAIAYHGDLCQQGTPAERPAEIRAA